MKRMPPLAIPTSAASYEVGPAAAPLETVSLCGLVSSPAPSARSPRGDADVPPVPALIG